MAVSKEFLELAQDSEDSVPKKFAWAKAHESRFRAQKNIFEFLIVWSVLLCITIAIPFVGLAVAITIAIVCGGLYLEARGNHRVARRTLDRISNEIGEEIE